MFSSIFNGFARPFLLCLNGLFANVALAGLIYFLPGFGVVEITWASVAVWGFIVVANVAILFVLFNPLRSYGRSGGLGRTTRDLFGFGLSSAATTVTTNLSSGLDTLALTCLQTTHSVGIYNTAQPLSRLFIMLGSSISKILFPISSEMYSRNLLPELRRNLSRILIALWVLLVPAAILLIYLAAPLLQSIFGKEYAQGSLAARMLLATAAVHALTVVAVSVINGLGHPLKVTRMVAVAGLISALLYVLLIPRFSYNGAALAFGLGQLVMFGMSVLALKEVMDFTFPWGQAMRVALCGLGMLLVLGAVEQWFAGTGLMGHAMALAAGGASYIAGLFVFRVAAAKDVLGVPGKLWLVLGPSPVVPGKAGRPEGQRDNTG
jgi:O-antigen/teichoic acid export membrane protein